MCPGEGQEAPNVVCIAQRWRGPGSTDLAGSAECPARRGPVNPGKAWLSERGAEQALAGVRCEIEAVNLDAVCFDDVVDWDGEEALVTGRMAEAGEAAKDLDEDGCGLGRCVPGGQQLCGGEGGR